MRILNRKAPRRKAQKPQWSSLCVLANLRFKLFLTAPELRDRASFVGFFPSAAIALEKQPRPHRRCGEKHDPRRRHAHRMLPRRPSGPPDLVRRKVPAAEKTLAPAPGNLAGAIGQGVARRVTQQRTDVAPQTGKVVPDPR